MIKYCHEYLEEDQCQVYLRNENQPYYGICRKEAKYITEIKIKNSNNDSQLTRVCLACLSSIENDFETDRRKYNFLKLEMKIYPLDERLRSFSNV